MYIKLKMNMEELYIEIPEKPTLMLVDLTEDSDEDSDYSVVMSLKQDENLNLLFGSYGECKEFINNLLEELKLNPKPVG